MSKTVWISIVVIVVILGLGWWLLMKNQPVQAPSSETSTTPTTAPAMSVQPSAMSSESASPSGSGSTANAVTVSGSEFSFSPMTLTGKVGQPMTVTFKNTGKYPHNFTITELNVATKTIQPGSSDTVTFTPIKAGTFTYFCSVDSHEARGMKGTLTVQ